jgi:N-acetylglutamate synthase-like GNAT family acetyltransferase
MSITQEALQLDISYYEAFTKRIDTTWGTIFCNEKHPNYYDSNHAHIINACEDPQQVIDEVMNFYQSRNIIPRFYIYNLGVQQNLLSELKSRNFKYEELINPVQLWDNRVTEIVNNKKISIEKVAEANYQEALNIEGSIKEFGGRETIEKVYETQFKHPSFTYYLLRYEGIACSTACIFEDGLQARIESVATIEEFRGKGLIGVLIQFIQNEVQKRGIEKLWIFPINESVEKVYKKYGFQTVDKFINGHLFLSGKSIKEARE